MFMACLLPTVSQPLDFVNINSPLLVLTVTSVLIKLHSIINAFMPICVCFIDLCALG